MSIIDSILKFAGRHPAMEAPLKELNRLAINHHLNTWHQTLPEVRKWFDSL